MPSSFWFPLFSSLVSSTPKCFVLFGPNCREESITHRAYVDRNVSAQDRGAISNMNDSSTYSWYSSSSFAKWRENGEYICQGVLPSLL
ncbi:MAG: hypothetical protein NXY57DRAFT_536558 [Lentinula lateritia]|nr:MAG: hypothetical protein NXY57DRAFT_536558 [Lentinula lateritia]